MKVTKETINGREYTVIWHDEGDQKWSGDYRPLFGGGYTLYNPFNRNHIIATALPPLPRRPKPEDAPLLYRYMAEGFYIRGNTYNDFERERQECCIMPPTYDDEITGAVHSGNPVDVAIEE